jgi:hypothetical protein
MRDGRLRRLPDLLTCALSCLLVFMALTACQLGLGSRGPADGGASDASGASYGKVFLDRGECGSRGPDPREVPCGGSRAAAQVLLRHGAGLEPEAVCPLPTDFVLRISGSSGLPATRGYACMRNLQAPHPGDPGGGGGPHTVVGDCVYSSRAGGSEVEETPCDAAAQAQGARKPEFRVVAAVAERSRCPAATALYVRLDTLVAGERPVGCARRL